MAGVAEEPDERLKQIKKESYTCSQISRLEKSVGLRLNHNREHFLL
jgi:hypothetical protein